MTNIMAFTIKDENGPVYLCSDGQGTIGGEGKIVVQKLFAYGNTLFAGTGSHNRLLQMRDSLSVLKPDVPVTTVGERMLERGRELKLDGRKDGDRIDIIAAGYENGQITIYDVMASGNKDLPPHMFRVDGVFAGSGSSKIGPAFQRDMEMHHWYLGDVSEGMNVCFAYGEKAGEDMFVDDNLQIGLVDKKGVHLLYHPEIPLQGIDDHLDYFRVTLGLPPLNAVDFRQSHHYHTADIYSLLDDLYQALRINCANMQVDDKLANEAHTKSKVDQVHRDAHEAEREKQLKNRDRSKVYVSELTEAWRSKDIKHIADAVGAHTQRRMERFKDAVRKENHLRQGIYGPQLKLPF